MSRRVRRGLPSIRRALFPPASWGHIARLRTSDESEPGSEVPHFRGSGGGRRGCVPAPGDGFSVGLPARSSAIGRLSHSGHAGQQKISAGVKNQPSRSRISSRNCVALRKHEARGLQSPSFKLRMLPSHFRLLSTILVIKLIRHGAVFIVALASRSGRENGAIRCG